MNIVDSFKGKKVVITGGWGFIGATLSTRLVDLGAHITIVDSLIPEYGGNLFNIRGIEDRVVVNVSDVLHIGDKVKVKVMEVDAVRGKVSLSMKALDPNYTGETPRGPRPPHRGFGDRGPRNFDDRRPPMRAPRPPQAGGTYDSGTKF